MNLDVLDDGTLVSKTEGLVQEERDLLTAILHHLREIDRRRLFSALGYKSLFDFAVRRLGYSEDQAYRRITAMRTLEELPELEARISKGEISLTHFGIAHSLFRQEKRLHERTFSKQEKLDVFDKIAGQPTREAERIILSLATTPQTLRQDCIRAITPERVEVRFLADNDIHLKVAKLKGLLAHTNPDITLGELFGKLCDLGIEKWDKSTPAAPKKRRVKNQKSEKSLRQELFRRAKGACEHCGSHFALEIDHIRPRALGGSSTIENLRVLCRSCNQRAAIENLGLFKMDAYLNALKNHDKDQALKNSS